ncbi:enoyl-CoA hydratase [Futiania mangrovi]|uniref:Enoyl-CoA hydratase n=1 Tax=Futiania mangrovi TaxID=2959716 RepID=A0A9J6P9V2_9PROT|nr:enoyl-CoA hydratase [Futiania mangrovii]MCP1336772.1 enoyl-CoA hydratase [Futiania mangrovii]
MTDTATVSLRTEDRAHGKVAFLTVENERKLNTFSTPVMEAFVAAVEGLKDDADLRALVVTGRGPKAFVGGADIREMAGIRDEAGARAFITRVHRTCASLRDLPVPVIGRVNGYALGAGLELVAACDMRIASDNAVFGMPEVRVGIPSVVEAALLPGLIGWGRTRRLLILAENLDAAEALDWGLVEKVVPAADLDAAVDQWLDMIGAAGPQAIRAQKALIRQWEDLPLREAVAAGIDSFAGSWKTSEPADMLGAFFAEKDKAKKG